MAAGIELTAAATWRMRNVCDTFITQIADGFRFILVAQSTRTQSRFMYHSLYTL